MKHVRVVRVISIVILYLVLPAAAVFWALSYNSWQLKEELKWVSPLFLEINLLLIVVGLMLNLGLFREICRGISRKTRAMVLIVVIGGTLITMFVAPRTHRIFYDEDIYLNVGHNIANLKKAGMCNEGDNNYGEYICKRLEYSKEPNGWPYIISVIFRLTGPSHLAGHLMNNIIWGLSALVVFFTGFLLFKDERAGLFGALLFSLIPEGLRWSNTTAVEPSAALFSGLAILSLILFALNPGKRSLFLASVLVSFAFQFRAESGLILLPAGLIILFMAPRELLKERTYVFILLLITLAIPHLIHLYAVKGEGWGAPGGAKFALTYLKNNFPVNALFYLKNSRFPLLLTLFFFAGLVMPILKVRHEQGETGTLVRSCAWRQKTILSVWFLAFWGIFLFFYAGSYNFGADVRFSLLSYIPMASLAGFGASALSNWVREKFGLTWAPAALAVLVLFWSLSFFPYVRAETQEAWAARADHRYAEVMAESLPPESLVLTHNPNMFLLWGKNAAQASLATSANEHLRYLFSRYRGGIYFHYNFWCNVSDPLQQSFCKNILKGFETRKVMEFSEQNYTYALYELERKKPGSR